MYLSSRAARSNSDGSHLAQGSEGVSAWAGAAKSEQEKGEEAAHAFSTPGGQPRIWYFINSLPSRPESHRPHMR